MQRLPDLIHFDVLDRGGGDGPLHDIASL